MKNIDIDCEEEVCFFKESNEHQHVCLYCKRNKKAVSADDDYNTIIQRNGY